MRPWKHDGLAQVTAFSSTSWPAARGGVAALCESMNRLPSIKDTARVSRRLHRDTAEHSQRQILQEVLEAELKSGRVGRVGSDTAKALAKFIWNTIGLRHDLAPASTGDGGITLYLEHTDLEREVTFIVPGDSSHVYVVAEAPQRDDWIRSVPYQDFREGELKDLVYWVDGQRDSLP